MKIPTNATLTWRKVRAIRRAVRGRKPVNKSELARKYCVDVRTVTRIIAGETWKE